MSRFMNIWDRIDPSRVQPDNFVAVIEIPKGSKQKYEIDKATGMLRLDRILYTSTHYPANYGFLPLTLSEDGDALDVLVLCSESLNPLCMVECYPIGAISMIDNNLQDDKIIAVPFSDPQMQNYKDLHDLPNHLLAEIQHFFSVYKELEGKPTSLTKMHDRASAMQLIREALEAYRLV